MLKAFKGNIFYLTIWHLDEKMKSNSSKVDTQKMQCFTHAYLSKKLCSSYSNYATFYTRVFIGVAWLVSDYNEFLIMSGRGIILKVFQYFHSSKMCKIKRKCM